MVSEPTRSLSRHRSLPTVEHRFETTTTDAENGGFMATTVPMNTSSTLEPHQPNNQPQPELSTTYQYESWLIDRILSVLRFFTTLSAISDSWRQLLLRALFLQLNDRDVTNRQ